MDFQTSCLKLDRVYLRLTRWGEAVGLGSSPHAAVSLGEAAFPEQDGKRAETLLGRIIYLFKQAEEISIKFNASHENAGLLDPDQVLTAEARLLHQRTREICRRRQRNTGRGKKAKWALYEKAHFNRLIAKLQELVNDVFELFPAAKPQQLGLCDQEAAETQNKAALSMLKKMAAKDDKPLEQAIARLAAHKVSTDP